MLKVNPIITALSNILKTSALVCIVITSMIIAGCFLTEDDEVSYQAPTPIDPEWVTITSPSDTGYASTYCNDTYVRGEAFISDSYYRCCSGSATDTGVTVSWKNLTTSINGAANQSVRYCQIALGSYLYVCEHTWSAYIPLILGDNVIEVTATDPGGSGGTDLITINKPEYSYELSGLLSTNEDVGLGYFQTGIEVELSGWQSSTATPNSVDPFGVYKFICIPSGVYTVTPIYNLFDYNFDPSFLNFTVVDNDITNLDFKSDAYRVSGKITYSTSGYPRSGADVTIRNTSDVSLTISTDEDGVYGFVVPNGTYTITPSCWLCTYEYYLPDILYIDVNSQEILDLDFVYYP